MSKECSICGKPSFGFYGMCKDCMDKKNKGLIVKCEKCGTWHDSNKPCGKCGAGIKTLPKDEPLEIDITKPNTCLICGAETNGYHFCSKCFYKYSKKDLVIKITQCKNIDILDSNYNGSYVTDDGHIVKSMAERDIDNYLFKNNIRHAYEAALPIDNNKDHNLHPDFYLPKYINNSGVEIGDVYIEHLGFEHGSKEYDDMTNYKLSIYEKLGITLIITKTEDIKDVNGSLNRKLLFIKKEQINRDEN